MTLDNRRQSIDTPEVYRVTPQRVITPAWSQEVQYGPEGRPEAAGFGILRGERDGENKTQRAEDLLAEVRAKSKEMLIQWDRRRGQASVNRPVEGGPQVEGSAIQQP